VVQPGAECVNQADIGGSHADNLQAHLLITDVEWQDIRKERRVQHTDDLWNLGRGHKVRCSYSGATNRR